MMTFAQKRVPFFLMRPPSPSKRPSKRKPRQAVVAVFLGVEGGEVPADDLVLLVAFQPFGTGVPARDKSAAVEHVDRVVGDRLDEHTCLPHREIALEEIPALIESFRLGAELAKAAGFDGIELLGKRISRRHFPSGRDEQAHGCLRRFDRQSDALSA